MSEQETQQEMSEESTAYYNGRRRRERVREMMAHGELKEGDDYGVIPGTSKPTLLKPGAEILCAEFKISPVVKGEPKRIFKENMIAYEIIMQMVNKVTGVVEAEGVGMCSSRERRYKNQDAWNIANTLLKMAKKRALIDGALTIANCSSLLTQDLEDRDVNDGQERHHEQRQSQQPQNRPQQQNGQRPPQGQSNQRQQNGQPARQSAPSPQSNRRATTKQIENLEGWRQWAERNNMPKYGFEIPPSVRPGVLESQVITWTNALAAACEEFKQMPATTELIDQYEKLRYWAMDQDIVAAGYDLPPAVPENPLVYKLEQWLAKLSADVDAFQKANPAQEMQAA